MHHAWECMKCGELTYYEPTPVNVTRYKRFETAGKHHVYTVDEVTYLCSSCEAWTHKPDINKSALVQRWLDETRADRPMTVGGHAVMWTGVDENGNAITRNDWGEPKSLEDDDVEC